MSRKALVAVGYRWSMQIVLPKLHTKQQEVVDAAKRFNVLSCGRRWGKTTLGMDRIIHAVLEGKRVCWASPTYKMLNEVWRSCLGYLRPISSTISQQQHFLEAITGGTLDMWSLDNVDALRGRKYDMVVVDEAAMVPDLENGWNAVIRPTLADTKGSGWLLSTPRGHNYFWHLFNRGMEEQYSDWISWRMPTCSNPYIDANEVQEMRDSLPELTARQEIDAIPVLDGGVVFRNVENCVIGEPYTPSTNSIYVFGVDIGRSHDWTVVTVMDIYQRRVVEIDRYTNIGFKLQQNRIESLAAKYDPELIIVEINNFGGPMVEDLRDRGLPIRPFLTTNQSKKFIIETLALGFENGELLIPRHSDLISEIQAFEITQLPAGGFRYSAAKGGHDDCVISLALAYSAVSRLGRQREEFANE